MDFRAAALPPPAAHMPALFSQPPALPPPPPPSQAGLFLYPGLSSPVKPPSHLLPPHKVSPRNTATVPPLPQSLAPVTSVGQPPVSAASSQANSFAAALKSLARNAGGTEAKEPAAPSKSSRDSAPPMSPKRGPLHVPRAPHTDNPPPVVAIAPTPTHQRSRESAPITSSAADLKGSLPAEVSSHLTAAAGGDLPRAPAGFQPYRADEQQRLLEALYPGYASSAAAAAAAAAAGGLYSPAPTRPGYPPAPRRPEERYLESLYPLQHPLQHSLYGLEEQLYLERLGLLRPPLGVSGLSPYSPLLTAGRYPAPSELLHSPLYMSQSLYLQERLKLEEDTRRKLETERERSEREQRTERDRSEREQRAERSREPTSHAVAPSARERSPVRPVDTGATGSLKAEPRTSGARESRSPGERRSASSGGEQQTSPAAYRPYLPSPVPRPAPREPPLDLRTGAEPAPAAPAVTTNAAAAPPLAKPRSHKKTTVVRPFEDTVSAPAEPAAPVPTPAPAPVAEAPLNLSERSRPAERAEPPPAAAAPTEQLTSTLDQREELRRRGLKTEEPEPVRHLDLLTGPPCETVTSPEKLQFLAHVGLTTHSFKNDVELKKCERRAALHLPLSAATSPEGAAEPEKEPEPEPRPSSQLTAALNEAADMPAKLLFLERLGLRPVAAGDTAPAAAAGMAVQAAGASGAGSSGGSPSTAGSSSSGAGSPSQRKSDNSSRRDSAPVEEKGRRNRSSPSSRSSRSSRQSPQAAQTAPGAARQPASSPPAPPPAPEAAPRLALPGAAWPGMQAVTQMYTAYNKERAAATDQARRTQERLRAQQARLEETSRGLALRLNRQVAFRSLQWRQREAIQEQLDRLGALVRALPTRARRKH